MLVGSIASFWFPECANLKHSTLREDHLSLTILGLSTIQTLHLRKYRLDVASARFPLLPSAHVLKLSPALIRLEGQEDIVIEDWTCPGLENLVLPWIERITERFGLNEPVKVVCEKLAKLLSRNWNHSFER